MYGNGLDWILLGTLLLFAFIGYQRGFLIGLLSFVGFFGGALLGLQLAPLVAHNFTEIPSRIAAALAIAFGFAILGQTIALILASKLRNRLRNHSLRVADGIGGSAVSILAVLLVAWMIAAPLASAPAPWVSQQIRHSQVLQGVDEAMPSSLRSLYATFQDAIRTNEFPQIFQGIRPTRVPPVSSPDPALANSSVVRQARSSIVKVVGDAPSCDQHITGTGFVYASQRIMTNAHVVAGVRNPAVEMLGQRFPARVVAYDPGRDLAVLYVPQLRAPVLEFTGPARSGADAIVLGYPLGGPYTANAARIREQENIVGPNIYQTETVQRQVYSIRGKVRPGNSGGPLMAPDGGVYGVIFAASTDDPDTGYVLTAAEAAPVADRGRSTRQAVSTQGCD